MKNYNLNFFFKKKFILLYSPSLLKKNRNFINKIIQFSIFSISVNTKSPESEFFKKKFTTIENIDFDYILALGGGKTIDTAKLINYNFIINKNKKKLVVMPTLFGSGTEITTSAVSYYKLKKYTKQHDEIKPNKIIYNYNIALQAPKINIIYSAMDCFCQSLESIWSKKCNSKSLSLATKSLIISYSFLNSNLDNISIKKIKKISEASILVGKAMNITRTTAPHALSYPLTAHLNLPHGLAVSLVMKFCITKNIITIEKSNIIKIIKKTFKVSQISDVYSKYLLLMKNLKIDKKINISNNKIKEFIKEINIERLNNNPVKLNKKDISDIYSNL